MPIQIGHQLSILLTQNVMFPTELVELVPPMWLAKCSEQELAPAGNLQTVCLSYEHNHFNVVVEQDTVQHPMWPAMIRASHGIFSKRLQKEFMQQGSTLILEDWHMLFFNEPSNGSGITVEIPGKKHQIHSKGILPEE
ncbi:hypothetical protein BJ741DRAFT_654987 [Chytriomyces cf. hyalinus JEL632]|nr:hypothetical protein BJ741DRAFT_654987 [Chytriomyces cf. hyalinus JEL632]